MSNFDLVQFMLDKDYRSRKKDKRLKAEIKKLREALQVIAGRSHGDIETYAFKNHLGFGKLDDWNDRIAAIAKCALGMERE